jgi:ParB family transcriptional regulator, chromosome partitioning protein
MVANVALSKLVSGRRNPRRVKPEREAHRRLVASIRAFGLLEPLVVRPAGENGSKHYQVIAGNRRLAALREVHRASETEPKIACEIREADDATADALSLSENFAREAMHPLDEAEAFAKLASDDTKGVEAIGAEFGVSERYVRQRMKLAGLAGTVKAAYREGSIDTGTAEAFATVPEDRQLEVWKELNGHPRHAEQVRNVIANAWIDASLAQFDLGKLPDSAVSRDLFSDRVLVERQAFMAAQTQALESHRLALIEDGWGEVVVGSYENVHDRLVAMDHLEREFDAETNRKLERLHERQRKLEAKLDTAEEGDESALQEKFEALEAEEQEIIGKAREYFSAATKAKTTVFFILDADGKVRREVRVPRQRNHPSGNNSWGSAEVPGETKPPTSADLSDRQCAASFTHQALAVREALLGNPQARKRVLALMLHDKVRSEALAVRHDANGTTIHAARTEGFTSPVRDRLIARRTGLDPFADEQPVEDVQAFTRLGKLTAARLDTLIDVLVVECVTAHLHQPTALIRQLADELNVDIRTSWRPDADWLSGYQKIQLAHLLGELHGPTYNPAVETRKKSELVDVLAKLFSDAADGKLEDKKLAERANRWLPANLREATISRS